MITCRPWNPVAMKKEVPYTESDRLKEASQYSKAWRAVKYNPNATVTPNAWRVSLKSLAIREWWAQVTVTPDERRIIVFNNGTWIGLNGKTPEGGHIKPNSMIGASLLWKKAQKKEKKNMTSETINKIIPIRSPLVTVDVWSPWNLDSRAMSRHHW